MAGGSVGNLAVIISGNASPRIGALGQAEKGIGKFSQRISGGNFGNQVNISIKEAGEKAGGAFLGGFMGALTGLAAGSLSSVVGTVFNGVRGFAGEALQAGRDVENLSLAFKVLTGSAEGSAKMLADLRQLSAEAGYGVDELGKAARTLAGNGLEAANVAPLLKAITEVSAAIGADGEQLGRFALAVAQVTAKGRFMAQELNQLSEAGLAVSEVAKTMNVGVSEFRAKVEAGNVSAAVLYQTLQRLTTAGGRFSGFLGERAATGVGQIAALESQWQQFKATVGQGIISGLVESGILRAGKAGLDYLIGSGGQIRDGFTTAGAAMRSFAVDAARIAGAGVEIWASWGGSLIDDFVKPGIMGLILVRDALSGLTAASGSVDVVQVFAAAAPVLGMMAEQARNVIGLNATLAAQVASNPALANDPLVKAMKALDSLKMAPGNRGEEWANGMRNALEPSVGMWARLAEQVTKAGTAIGKLKIPKVLDGETQEFAQSLTKRLAEGLTPADKFGRRMGMLDEALFFDQGKTLKPGAYRVGQYETFLELERSLTKFKDEFPKAVEAGSVEAASAINRAMYGQQSGTVQERILAVINAAKANSDQVKKDVKDISNALLKINLKAMGF